MALSGGQQKRDGLALTFHPQMNFRAEPTLGTA
jgi:ABC-type taurine transport system ATPase subunit